MNAPASLLIGGTFGAYEVKRRLGGGGMGEVYLCRHRLLNRLDAVKVLHPQLATADESFRFRFIREVRIGAQVRVGIHAVIVVPPGAVTPIAMSTLDVDTGGARCRLTRGGEPPVDGDVESVTAEYVREFADVPPDA